MHINWHEIHTRYFGVYDEEQKNWMQRFFNASLMCAYFNYGEDHFFRKLKYLNLLKA